MIRIIPQNDVGFSAQINPIPLNYFYRWRDTYLSRNSRFDKLNKNSVVDLSDEDLFVDFDINAIENLLNNAQNGQFLTVHLTSNGNGSRFNKLSATICIMEKLNINPKSGFIWPININPIPDSTTEKANFMARKNTIRTSPNIRLKEEFINDEDGVSYLIDDDLRSYFRALRQNVRVIFVKVPELEDSMIGTIGLPGDRKGKMSVAFAPVSFDPTETLSAITFSMDIRDFGSGCCPPA